MMHFTYQLLGPKHHSANASLKYALSCEHNGMNREVGSGRKPKFKITGTMLVSMVTKHEIVYTMEPVKATLTSPNEKMMNDS